MDSSSSQTVFPKAIQDRIEVSVTSRRALDNDGLDKVFDVARQISDLISKKDVLLAQAMAFKILREYPGDDSKYVVEEAISGLSENKLNLSKENTFVNSNSRAPVRLGESLWLCYSTDLPDFIRQKVDKSHMGFYLLDTRLIDPDDRHNSNGVSRFMHWKDERVLALSENKVSNESKAEIGSLVISQKGSSSGLYITREVSVSPPLIPPKIEKTPLEKTGLTLQDVLSPLKGQLQDPNITNVKLIQELIKAENLLVNGLNVHPDEFKAELILVMKDYVSSPETSIVSLEQRQKFFYMKNMEEMFMDCIADRVHNDISVKGTVGREQLNLIKTFHLKIKNPIYKDFLFNRAVENFEFDLRNDSYTDVEESVRLASKFLSEAMDEAKNAGVEKKELTKALYNKLLDVANSPSISNLTLAKCRAFGKRLGALDRMPDFTEVISTVIMEPLDKKVELAPGILTPEPYKLDAKPEQSVEARTNETVTAPRINESKFPFSCDDLKGLTPAEVAKGITDAFSDELLTVLFNEGSDKRFVQLLDSISSGSPLSVALRKSSYGNDISLADKHLKAFLRGNKTDPNLSKIILTPDIKQVIETEIKCPPENLFELVDEHGNVNLRGHLISLATKVEGVNLVYEENKLIGMEIDDYRIREKNELGSQQGCLNKVIKMVQDGDLIVYGSKANNGLIKLEVEYMEKGEKAFLACLHPSTNSRIWGIYTPRDGKMVFKGICADHDEWSGVINSFKRKEGSTVVA